MTLFVTASTTSGVILQQASDTRPWVETLDTWPVADGCELVVIPAQLTARLDYYRVVDGHVVERPGMPVDLSTTSIAADGAAECVLSGLPDPCTVTITGAVHAGALEVTGGSLIITSTAPGAITISVAANPVWKPWEGVIDAV
jgi:hypothetical protein